MQHDRSNGGHPAAAESGDPVDDTPLILIAEDDADNREGYAEYLTYLGYQVAQAVPQATRNAIHADSMTPTM